MAPLKTELKNGDVVEIITTAEPNPNPAWLSFVRTGRARSKIRHYLKTMAQKESLDLGDKLLTQSLRAEGIEKHPNDVAITPNIWEKILRFTGNKNKEELLVDIGLGKRVASIVAKRLTSLLAETGEKPNALLISQERFASTETLSQGDVIVDGSENASVQYARCCHPVPMDPISGYLGHGEGLVIHQSSCAVAQRLKHKDSERFIYVEWSDEPVRMFDAPLTVTVKNAPGVLAKVANAISMAEADITHVNMAEEVIAMDTIDLKFTIAVRDLNHIESVLKSLRRTSCVTNAKRIIASKHHYQEH
jgi:GTP pyrophosphokinase